MADGNITKDAMYGAVAPDDFQSMIELLRPTRSGGLEPDRET